MKRKTGINWPDIDVVLLDMDGTLIDQHHEDVFWEQLVPKAYAKKHKLSLKEAEGILFNLYQSKSGTVEWGNIDNWEKDLGIKLWQLRHKIKLFIKLHPHTLRFLKFLKRHNKKIYLVSSAPKKSIDTELKHAKIQKYFDGFYNELMISKCKHDKVFWKRLQRKIKFDKNRTLLAEDNERILRAAKSFGIRWVVFKSKYSSRKPPHIPKGLFYVHHFDELIRFK